MSNSQFNFHLEKATKRGVKFIHSIYNRSIENSECYPWTSSRAVIVERKTTKNYFIHSSLCDDGCWWSRKKKKEEKLKTVTMLLSMPMRQHFTPERDIKLWWNCLTLSIEGILKVWCCFWVTGAKMIKGLVSSFFAMFSAFLRRWFPQISICHLMSMTLNVSVFLSHHFHSLRFNIQPYIARYDVDMNVRFPHHATEHQRSAVLSKNSIKAMLKSTHWLKENKKSSLNAFITFRRQQKQLCRMEWRKKKKKMKSRKNEILY